MQSKAQDGSKKIARKSNNFMNHCFTCLGLLSALFDTHDSLNIANGNNFKNRENDESNLKDPMSIKDDEKHQHRCNSKDSTSIKDDEKHQHR